MTRRLLGFGVICVVLAATGWWLLARGSRPGAIETKIRIVAGAEARARIIAGAHVVFRSTDPRSGYGLVAMASLDRPGERLFTELACERVAASGAHGICLAAERGFVTTYSARLLDAALEPGAELPLTGLPSRARVSPDGLHVAFTVFESGHSYASAAFSTRTTIVDTRTAKPVGGDLEQWPVTRDAALIRAPDFNLWGVTFARDGDRFYATLATGGSTFLVEGSLAKRAFHVVREGVECPALSPDDTRIVFKSRRLEAGRPVFGLRVLELASGREVPLDGELRNVDDQAAWLDDEHVLYALPEERMPATGGADVWVMEARSGAPPRILLEQAYSPAVVR